MWSAYRLSIEDAANNNDWVTYGVNVGEWCVSPVVLLFFAVLVAGIVCFARSADKRGHAGRIAIAVALGAVAAGVAIALMLMLFQVRRVIDDGNGVVDSIVASMDRGTAHGDELHTQALALSPSIQTYLDGVEAHAFVDMQNAWTTERSLRPLSIENITRVEAEIQAIRGVAHQIRTTLTDNNTQALQQFDDGRRQWIDGRQYIVDNRYESRVAMVRSYALWATLALLGLVLITAALVSPRFTPVSTRRFAFLPELVLVLILAVFMALAVPWDDACIYSRTLEARDIRPTSNTTAFRVAHACIHNTSLLAAAGINTTHVLNLTQLIQFPAFPSPTVLNPDDVLDKRRVAAMQLALDQSTTGIRTLYLEPFFANVTRLAEQAYCGKLGTDLVGTRDDVCNTPMNLYMLVLFGCVFALLVSGLVIFYTTTCCQRKQVTDYHAVLSSGDRPLKLASTRRKPPN